MAHGATLEAEIEAVAAAATLRVKVRHEHAARPGLTPWRAWLADYFASYTTAPFAPRHIRLWEWFDGLRSGQKPPARVEVWPRGGAKSSSAELGVTRVGATLQRRFVLYLSGTQPQADKHVESIGGMFERLGIGRAVNQYGQSRGWRHNELHTAEGFNVIALGLDAAIRGVKIDEFRPDLIILDDIDDRHDSDLTRRKKIETITTAILPSGSADCAVLVVQNLITEDSIVAQLADGRADFLHNRVIGTNEPAIVGLAYEHRVLDDRGRYVITAGEPTWAGQDRTTCERQLNEWGLNAFLREAQHEVAVVDGGLWDATRDIEKFRVLDAPELVRVAVALDPNASSTGDAAGIMVGGIDARGHGYLLDDCSVNAGPEAWADESVRAYRQWEADVLLAEVNNGGDMVSVTIRTVADAPPVKQIHASRGKATRAEPVQRLCAQGQIHHVGRFPQLERELCTWQQGMPSPNRLDAYVWLFTELLLGAKRRRPVAGSGETRPSAWRA